MVYTSSAGLASNKIRELWGGGDMLLRKMVWFGLACVSTVVLFGCNNSGTSKKISLEKRDDTQLRTEGREYKPLRIAVGGMITPREGFVYYREFIDYIGEKLNRPVEFVDREKYDEINRLMKSGQIDIAFVCSGPYVDGHDENKDIFHVLFRILQVLHHHIELVELVGQQGIQAVGRHGLCDENALFRQQPHFRTGPRCRFGDRVSGHYAEEGIGTAKGAAYYGSHGCIISDQNLERDAAHLLFLQADPG